MSEPKRIYLQWHGDEDPAVVGDSDPPLDEVTWTADEPVFEQDICYVREDALARLLRIEEALRFELDNYLIKNPARERLVAALESDKPGGQA